MLYFLTLLKMNHGFSETSVVISGISCRMSCLVTRNKNQTSGCPNRESCYIWVYSIFLCQLSVYFCYCACVCLSLFGRCRLSEMSCCSVTHTQGSVKKQKQKKQRQRFPETMNWMGRNISIRSLKAQSASPSNWSLLCKAMESSLGTVGYWTVYFVGCGWLD